MSLVISPLHGALVTRVRVENLDGGVKLSYQGLSSSGRPENVGETWGCRTKTKMAVPCEAEGSNQTVNSPRIIQSIIVCSKGLLE